MPVALGTSHAHRPTSVCNLCRRAADAPGSEIGCEDADISVGASHESIKRIVTSWAVAFGLMFFAPGNVLGHCDSLDGPVVKAAQRGLETRNLPEVLIWVQADDTQEVRAAFEQALVVRALSPERRELADR